MVKLYLDENEEETRFSVVGGPDMVVWFEEKKAESEERPIYQ